MARAPRLAREAPRRPRHEDRALSRSPGAPVALRRGGVLAAAALALVCSPAHGWDDLTHVSIARAAFLVSPAAAARVPEPLRASFFDATAAIEITDVTCRKHVAPGAAVESAALAAATIEELRRTWDGLNEFRRVELMARAVHFAADAAVPAAVRRGQRVYAWAFFPNRDLAVFRERSPLAPPFDEALRRRGSLALWADDGPGADGVAYRLAVNLAIETLLLFPAAGPAAPPDDGPAVFVINRLVRRAPITGKVVDGVGDGAPPPTPRGGGGETAALGPSEKRERLLAKRGVQIAEWASRLERGKTTVRLVLMNNDDSCATRIVFQSPAWRHELAGRISPAALRTVSLELPPAVVRSEITVTAQQVPCPGQALGPGEAASANRLVFWATGTAPTFSSPADLTREDAPEEAGAASGPAGAGPVLSAEIDPALMEELPGGLKAGPLSCEVERTPWTCRLPVRSTGGTPPPSLTLRLLVTLPGSKGAVARPSVTFDLRGLPFGARRELVAPVSPGGRGRPQALHVEGVAAGR